jgi:UDP-N-acetylglucosamine--N-acetylmuramyl-(pentapeptide) pyrophosphoryl-undecaprenol N-acetylglucosamine transferase
MPTLLLTGGGTAGHVTPHLALIPVFQAQGWNVAYIGSNTGLERNIIPADIPYYGVTTGKLRRYWDIRTLLAPFAVLWGIIQATALCRKLKPQVVFSKGGFVAFPVVVGAWLNRIPVVCHESDLTPGLANRLCFPFCRTICLTFAQTRPMLSHPEKAIVTGTPIRAELKQGDRDKGLHLCGFTADKPVLMIMGGSQGAQRINEVVRQALPQLLPHYQVVHLCGKGKVDAHIHSPGYKQFEYLDKPLKDVLACADIVISRAGANSVYELIALRKRHIFIPLPLSASRGDQILNARHFQQAGISEVIDNDTLSPDTLMTAIANVEKNKAAIDQRLQEYVLPDSVPLIVNTILALQ